MDAPMFYRARIDFEFGGVKVKAGDVLPAHRPPWNVLVNYGQMYLDRVEEVK